jgi:FixJ family two-component response regulator
MSPPLVRVVDDDASVLRAIGRLLKSEGLFVQSFDSPAALLDNAEGEADCLVLDIDLPGMNGLELHRRLLEAGAAPPVIFITGVPDEASRVRAMTQQAVAYLEKPVEVDLLLDAIEQALAA